MSASDCVRTEYPALYRFIEEVMQKEERPMRNATLRCNAQKTGFDVVAEQVGYTLDRDRLYDAVLQAVLQFQTQLQWKKREIQPTIRQEQLQDKREKRSTFTTQIKSQSADRTSNIATALRNFNGFVLAPGEKVSFNATTGTRNAANGYKPAKIIVNGVYVDGYGGGVCQASTTLYNALLLADVEILEVHNHSLPPSYVRMSFDAMVNTGSADLVFVNTTPWPMGLLTRVFNGTVQVSVYGAPMEYEIHRRSEVLETLPQGTMQYKVDTEGKYADLVTYTDERVLIQAPKAGYRTRGYLQYYRNGVMLSEKHIRSDTYKPTNGLCVQGSVPRPQTSEPTEKNAPSSRPLA